MVVSDGHLAPLNRRQVPISDMRTRSFAAACPNHPRKPGDRDRWWQLFAVTVEKADQAAVMIEVAMADDQGGYLA
jgi:hypothetical protein